MNDLTQILALTLLAGLTMPLGAAFAMLEKLPSPWLEKEFQHSVIAFGGGALLAAVSLVLVPDGIKNLSILPILCCFAGGGLAFMLLDKFLAEKQTSLSQLVAMLSDFVPEALALGATFTLSHNSGLLLAGIIALQNLPEGFNAYKEIKASTSYGKMKILGIFSLMAFLGPLAAGLGYLFLSNHHQLVSGIMLFAAGGILYLIFQDIAKQSTLKKHWAPPLGAVAGFLLGIIGKVAISG